MPMEPTPAEIRVAFSFVERNNFEEETSKRPYWSPGKYPITVIISVGPVSGSLVNGRVIRVTDDICGTDRNGCH